MSKLKLFFLSLCCISAFCTVPMTVHADILKDIQSDHDDAMKDHDEWKKEHSEARDLLKKAKPLLKWANSFANTHNKHMTIQETKIAAHEKRMSSHKKAKDPTLAKLRDQHNSMVKDHKELEAAHEHLHDDYEDFKSIIEKLAKFKDEMTEHSLKEKYKPFHK